MALALVWLLGMSGLRWSQRGSGLLLLLLLGGAFAGLVRKDGHMGDFLPQLAWRWQARPGEAATEPLVVPAGLSYLAMEELRVELEARMRALTAAADGYFEARP